MINVQQAEELILQNLPTYPVVVCPLHQSYGRILREDIRADRESPACDKSLVDGVAIHLESYLKGQRQFEIESIQPAGKRAVKLLDQTKTIEIMTGAPVPYGCDCVIPIEQVKRSAQSVLMDDSLILKKGQGIRLQGSDHKKGDILLKSRCRMTASGIGIAASVGKARLKVAYVPKIAIISTGDELVDINTKVQPYQVRTSNSYAIEAALHQHGFLLTTRFHFPDDLKSLTKQIKRVLDSVDVLILSGGVSMGKFDFVPQVLEALRVKKIFHKVKQKPGKPFWFGKRKSEQLIFALPGNPVSTLLCLYRYVLPALEQAQGLEKKPPEECYLFNAIDNKSDLAHFVPVRIIKYHHAALIVDSVKYEGSGDFAALESSDGVVEIPSESKVAALTQKVNFYRW